MTYPEFEEAYYEDLNGLITKLSFNSHEGQAKLELHLQCDDWNDKDQDRIRQFQFKFEGVIDWTVQLGGICGINLTDQHPLIEERTGKQGQLFFTSLPKDPAMVLAKILDFHLTKGKEWKHFAQFLHCGVNKLQVGYGSFAAGPLSLMQEYQNLLSAELKLSLVKTHEIPMDNIKAMFFYNNYVLFHSFDFREL